MRVVLTGASGQLGGYVWDRLLKAEHEVVPWGSARGGEGLRAVELTDPAQIDKALADADPEVILHTAAMSTAEGVRLDPERARSVNVDATSRLADWCRQHGRRLIYTSTDLVFDGSRSFSCEDDSPNPVLAYGRSKADAEPSVTATPRALVVRLSLLYGPSRSPGRLTYFDRTVSALKNGESQTFFEDEFRTPLDLATAATVLVRLAEMDMTGIVHLGGRERLSRYELARRVATALGLESTLVRANRQSDVVFPEPRPSDVSLDTGRVVKALPDLIWPTVEDAAITLWQGLKSETRESETK